MYYIFLSPHYKQRDSDSRVVCLDSHLPLLSTMLQCLPNDCQLINYPFSPWLPIYLTGPHTKGNIFQNYSTNKQKLKTETSMTASQLTKFILAIIDDCDSFFLGKVHNIKHPKYPDMSKSVMILLL